MFTVAAAVGSNWLFRFRSWDGLKPIWAAEELLCWATQQHPDSCAWQIHSSAIRVFQALIDMNCYIAAWRGPVDNATDWFSNGSNLENWTAQFVVRNILFRNVSTSFMDSKRMKNRSPVLLVARTWKNATTRFESTIGLGTLTSLIEPPSDTI